MMVDEPSSQQEHSPSRITEDMLGGLEPKGSELMKVPLEVDKEVGTNAGAVDEIPQDRGLEEEILGLRGDQGGEWGWGGSPAGR